MSVLPARLLQVWPAVPQAARPAREGGPGGGRPPDRGQGGEELHPGDTLPAQQQLSPGTLPRSALISGSCCCMVYVGGTGRDNLDTYQFY